MRRRIGGVVAIVVAGLLAAWGAEADTLHLADGSVVHGTVTGIKDGKVTIKTEFAGDLSIPLDKVSGIVTDEAQGVKLKDGEVLSGTLQYEEGTQRLVRDEIVVEVEPSGLVGIGPVEVLSAPPKADWKGRAELGLTGETGNTEQFDVRTRVESTRTTEVGRLRLYLRAEYGEENGERTDNEYIGGLRYEHDISKRFYVFVREELEYDEFENLDLRLTTAGGLGYFLIRSDRQELKARAGLGYIHEEFDDGSSADNLFGEFGYDYRLHVRTWLQYTSMFTYFMNFTEFEDWRFEAENAAEIPISNSEAWKIRLGVRNEYDNEPQPGVESLDTSYFASLVYNWD